MYIVNRKLDRQFDTFEEALNCAIESFLRNYCNPNTPWVLKKTPKGWTVKAKKPRFYNHCFYPSTQFIQEIKA